jgi:hypothetical protein
MSPAVGRVTPCAPWLARNCGDAPYLPRAKFEYFPGDRVQTCADGDVSFHSFRQVIR